ncbi:MAG: InlB B-repeat-containing protein, partial [Treponema sp.]|nr:InlB B-repeat-containing protein [Treponema sp.]
MKKTISILAVSAIFFAFCLAAFTACKTDATVKDFSKITFNKNNTDAGSADANPRTMIVKYPAGTIDSLPEPPTRNDYIFNGWNHDPEGDAEEFDVGSSIVNENGYYYDFTVYAQWLSPGVRIEKNGVLL